MPKLKLQYFAHLYWRTNSLVKILMLGNTEGRRRGGQQKMKWLDGRHWFNGLEFQQALEDGEGQGSLACCSPWCHKETWLSNWTTIKIGIMKSVPENIYLNTCSTRIPGAQSASLYIEIPQTVLKVNSCSITGLNLCRGRWKMPLLLFRLWQVFLASPNL